MSGLFEFWKARVPVTSVSGFIGRIFPESGEDHILSFLMHWLRNSNAVAGDLFGATKNDETASNSLGEFRDCGLFRTTWKPEKRQKKQKKKGQKPAGRCEFLDPADDSNEDSSEDDQGGGEASEDDDFAKYCCLSPKCLQIISCQDRAKFATFFKLHALQIAKEADLYEVIGHFRASMKCASGLCRVDNLPVAHESTPEDFRGKQIRIVLSDLRAHAHL